MKFLFDLFPIILFFIAFKLANLHYLGVGLAAAAASQAATQIATATAIVATIAQVIWTWWRHRKIETMLWISLVLILFFGGATILLHDARYIQWKPTVLYWLFAVILLVSDLAFGKNLIAAMLKSQLSVPTAVWRKLNFSWTGFFTLMGIANLYVAWHYSMDTWVSFKLFGTLGLTIVFVLLQGVMLAKYVEDKE
jgi:intracellular septation protein